MNKYLHACPEWDFMEIDENDFEVFCCHCFDDEEFKRIRNKRNQELDEYNRSQEI